MKVIIESPILTQSGYGEHSRLVFESIKDLGLEVHLCPLKWGNTPWALNESSELYKEIKDGIIKFEQYNNMCNQTGQNPHYDMHIHVGILSEYSKKAEYSVCVTAGIETDRVSADWLMKTHSGLDKIIVPSQHAKDGFKNTAYEIIVKNENGQQEKQILQLNEGCDIETIPYPVKQHKKSNINIDFETNFNFLQVALLGPRKNIEQLLVWFLEEFRDDEDVGLILKTGVSRSSKMDRIKTISHFENIIDNFPNSKCKVYLIHGNLSESEINCLYTHPKIKAYVSTTHGEGYGLPIFEAAYNGLPIIATNWSGHLDFLSAEIKENNKLKEKKLFAKVDFDLKSIPTNCIWDKVLVEGSQWAIPKSSSFKSQIRKVYKNYGMYKKWAVILQEKIKKTHSKEIILSKMAESLIPKSKREWAETLNEIEIL